MTTFPPGRLIGAHMSTSGGVAKGVQNGVEFGCTAIQIFAKNNNRWMGKMVAPAEAETFKAEWQKSPIRFIFSHAGYLINLCAPDPENYERSIASMRQELELAERLGLPWVNVHPGCHVQTGEAAGLRKIAESLRHLLAETSDYAVGILLENTAGQGSALGYSFAQLAELLEKGNNPQRLGICIDTCHAFAAGYDLKSEKGYQAAITEFDRLVGLPQLKALHLNDSKFPLGSRKDRHEHIGEGCIGLDAFRFILNDSRLTPLPMVLETPKGDDHRADFKNLATLRSLIH